MPKSTKKVKKDVVQQLVDSLEDEEHEDEVDQATLHAQVAFWTEMRSRLMCNHCTVGLEILDELAVSVIDQDPHPRYLDQVVTLLPPPADMHRERPPLHALFQPKFTSKTVLTKRSASSSRVPPPTTKKARIAPKSKAKTTSRSYSLNLPDDIHPSIKADLNELLQQAVDEGKAPFRLAYPWKGQRAWYDPTEYPDLHLQHYRFWMASREAFWLSALYPPTKNSNPRRKAKTYAVQARLRFISRCIEFFGYFDFLRRLENTSHDTLMWFGGKAAKHAPGSKSKTSSFPAPEDLATLHKKDRARYDRTIARAYDPLSIDEDGYSSIPELLEQTQALDPSLSEPNRLSDRALARVFLDVTQTVPPNTNWVGNRNTGIWKKLLSNRTIGDAADEIQKQLNAGAYAVSDEEKPYDLHEQGADYSDFEDDDQDYTVLPPPQSQDSTIPPSDHDSDNQNDDREQEAQETTLPDDGTPSAKSTESQLAATAAKPSPPEKSTSSSKAKPVPKKPASKTTKPSKTAKKSSPHLPTPPSSP
ncbi:hypothetical protein DVH05_017181 [Phytophthora capsici]|nr:hypothetical protein DVH05_017181 [Phytophthora capsici]